MSHPSGGIPSGGEDSGSAPVNGQANDPGGAASKEAPGTRTRFRRSALLMALAIGTLATGLALVGGATGFALLSNPGVVGSASPGERPEGGGDGGASVIQRTTPPPTAAEGGSSERPAGAASEGTSEVKEPPPAVPPSEEPESSSGSGSREASPRADVPQAALQSPPTGLSLTVPSIGVRAAPVENSVSESVLATGAGKLPGSGYPSHPGANTYIAAHVYGYPGTGSWRQFAELPELGLGERVYLTQSGTVYTYEVSEVLEVSPTDTWVARPQPGRQMVSLQTCTGPGWSERLVVRGDLVDTMALR